MMRLRPFIGWAVFFFLIAIIAQAVPSVSGSYYFLKGKRLYSKGDYRAAVAAYESAVSSDPKSARGYVELGLSYYQLEKYGEAEGAFSKAAGIHDDSCAQCGLGMVLHAQGRNNEAEAALKKAQALDPGDTCAFYQIGRVYYDQKRYLEAIEIFRKEIQIRPTAIAYHYLGASYSYIDKFEEARDAYQAALRQDPKYTEVYVYLGHAWYRLGRHPEAIEAYRKAIKAHPDDVVARVSLGLTELKQGNTRAAIEQYEILRSLDPDQADILKRALVDRDTQPVGGLVERKPKQTRDNKVEVERSRSINKVGRKISNER
jgi:tetratricopeptide (TPR) repeat protein